MSNNTPGFTDSWAKAVLKIDLSSQRYLTTNIDFALCCLAQSRFVNFSANSQPYAKLSYPLISDHCVIDWWKKSRQTISLSCFLFLCCLFDVVRSGAALYFFVWYTIQIKILQISCCGSFRIERFHTALRKMVQYRIFLEAAVSLALK
jgi:hypothetical protein